MSLLTVPLNLDLGLPFHTFASSNISHSVMLPGYIIITTEIIRDSMSNIFAMIIRLLIIP